MNSYRTFTPSDRLADQLSALPVLRTPAEAEGLVLSIPAAGLTVVPLHRKEDGWMTVVAAGVYGGALPGAKLLLSDDIICSAAAVDTDRRRLLAAAGRTGELSSKDLLAAATEFSFTPAGARRGDTDLSHFTVKVEYRSDRRWAVTNIGRCWGPEGWVWESSPSGRTDEFLDTHRFSLEEAVAIARILPDHLTVNGRTWAGWQEHFAR